MLASRACVAGAVLALSLSGCDSGSAPGVQEDRIQLGSVLALNGPAQGLGQGMRDGLEAALEGRSVHGRRVEISFLDDSYRPVKAVESTQRLLDRPEGVFAMVGNVGTPTAKVTLPVLREEGVPAIGFFTGAGILRPGDGGPILNFRASYVEEVGTVVREAISHGIAPSEVCAYVQNDAYGMAGIVGVRQALEQNGADAALLSLYDEILSREGNEPVRNFIGPVGVYARNTTEVEPGYHSLKTWEQRSGQACRLVVTVGAYTNIAHFTRFARKSDDWIISAVSFTGADNFRADLERYGVSGGILMTQVVPLLDSRLAIVQEAKRALGPRYGFVSLEGYIVGRMLLKLLEDTGPEPNPQRLMEVARAARFNLGGIEIDFSRDGNQASRLVNLSQLTDTGWVEVQPDFWARRDG